MSPVGAPPAGLHVLVRGRTFAVVAKPAPLVCHNSRMVAFTRDTLIARVRARFGPEARLVHRLDRQVTGCLLVAFGADAMTAWHAALTDAGTTKTYWAFVRGRFAHQAPVAVDRPLKDEDGVLRDARSVVRLLGGSAEPRCSLLAVTPETGRLHQVRRHVRGLDAPILGDARHGDTRASRWWREHHGLARLALHCARLRIDGPEGRVDARCPPPADLAALWRALPWWSDAVAADPQLAWPPLDLDTGIPAAQPVRGAPPERRG